MTIMVYKATTKGACLVSLLILTTLLCMAEPVSAATNTTGIHYNDGTAHDVHGSLDITTSSDNTSGIQANGDKTVISAGDEIVITTKGASSYGVYADTSGTILMGKSIDITTSGQYAYGAFASGSSNITIGDSATIKIAQGLTHAAYAENSSNVTIGDSAYITTSGDGAYGALAQSDSSINIGSSADITTSGNSAVGVFAKSSDITIGSSANITTSGNSSYGTSAWHSSSIRIGDSADITTSGRYAHGAYTLDNSSMDIGGPATITTSGDSAVGVFAEEYSNIKIGGEAVITTKGQGAYGTYAVRNSNIKIGDSTDITTSGQYAFGVLAEEHSNIKIGSGANVSTSEIGAYSALAWGNSGITIGKGANLSTIGEKAHALYAVNDSYIQLDGAAISATGEKSLAVYSQSGSQITGSGIFKITGDMFTESANSKNKTIIDLTLEDGSTFTGMTSYTSNDAQAALNLTLNGADTVWVPTGDSDLTNLYMNGAVVDFTQAFGLSVTTVNLGKSDSDNGIFRMEANIAETDADHLRVLGTAQGTYIIDVVNVGSGDTTGDELTDLVYVNPGQSAVFVLDHIVEIGGWQYDLNCPDCDMDEPLRRSKRAADGEPDAGGGLEPRGIHQNNAWYLRGLQQASTAGSGAINSFAGSYLMAYAETNTLMQRMGDLRQSPYSRGLWFRAHGGKFESNAKSYVRGFDMKYGGVQIGYDRKIENKWDGDIYAGVMFGYSKGDLDYFREGSGGVDSKALGVYGVYTRPDGFYIDATLKYQWMTNDFDVIDTAGTLVRGNDVDTGGLGFSVEFGKRIPFSGTQKSGWYAEPQLQFSYQRQDGGYFNATNGLNVGVDPFTSLLGRVGMLVGYETEKTNFYGKVSKAKEFDGDLTIHANGVPIAESFGGSWWVYGLGFTTRVNDRNSLHLDIERTSGGSFSQPWRINAGWRMEF